MRYGIVASTHQIRVECVWLCAHRLVPIWKRDWDSREWKTRIIMNSKSLLNWRTKCARIFSLARFFFFFSSSASFKLCLLSFVSWRAYTHTHILAFSWCALIEKRGEVAQERQPPLLSIFFLVCVHFILSLFLLLLRIVVAEWGKESCFARRSRLCVCICAKIAVEQEVTFRF